MNRAFLDILSGELGLIRGLTDGFAERHPDVAERLRLGPDGSDDPHVERLIGAVAMLTARVRAKLDDEFPIVIESVLNALFPHYLRPLPAASVVRFRPREGQTEPMPIPAGATIRTERVEGEDCRFRTTCESRLLPAQVAEASYGETAIVTPPKGVHVPPRAAAALVLGVESIDPSLPLAGLTAEDLAFHLRVRSSHGATNRLYETLLNECVGGWFEAGGRSSPVLVGGDIVSPRGFDPGEAMLPADPRVQPAYRMLAEYSAYPWKFHALRIGPPPGGWPDPWPASKLRIVLFFDRLARDLVPLVDASTFALGAVPVINIAGPVRAEPIEIDHRTANYRVAIDHRRDEPAPIFEVERVEAISSDDRPLRTRPVFDPMRESPGEDPSAPIIYWNTTRELTRSRAAGGSPMSELFISFVGEDLETTQISAVATPVVLGTDGELPMRLPVSDSRPQLYLESEAEIGGANLLFAPVPPRSPWADPSLTLRLIAHMRLNRLPVVPGGTSPDTLRSMLELYDFDGEGSARNRRLRESLHSVRSRVANARVEGEISRGLEVELEIDNEAVPDRETFLLASVLERVLPDLCSINSFVATSLRIRGHEELTKAWPPRTGTRVLI